LKMTACERVEPQLEPVGDDGRLVACHAVAGHAPEEDGSLADSAHDSTDYGFDGRPGTTPSKVAR
ncbi:MAG TPA: hypothetical protein VIG41_10585, partial [Micrococcaceae bacterium]